jgi:hypothetical protein
VRPASFSHTLKEQAEAALTDSRFDFIAKYHAVSDLRRLARKKTEVLDEESLLALERLLHSDVFQEVRQAYFLFREAAAVMTDLAVNPNSNGLGSRALASLIRMLGTTSGKAHRGVAEALGGLPVSVSQPKPVPVPSRPPVRCTWERLTQSTGTKPTGALRYIGRSLTAETEQPDRLLVVKLGKAGDTAAGLAGEIHWMEKLSKPDYEFACRFDIPTPITVDQHPLLQIDGVPLPPPAGVTRHPDKLAIAFLAHRDYFSYPNDPGVDEASAMEALGRNAYLLGRLTAQGIIHNAPIPLFHNRTQRLRREDQGRYQWFRSGRLDQWLASCAFPNFGISGLRDFEHLEIFDGSRRNLYRHMGSHFLSLLLVAGSFFRNKDRSKAGLDENGNPVDVRHLFDRQVLRSMIRSIFKNYFTGFAQKPPTDPPPLNVARLAERMITEMGVDRHMTELLRAVDQRGLTDVQFYGFLEDKRYRNRQLEAVKRGEKDILITSGPHLGDFNRQICLPELIESVAAMSAVCVAGRFMRES